MYVSRTRDLFSSCEVESMMKNADVENAIEQNNEEWQKRMLLLVLVMVIALIAMD